MHVDCPDVEEPPAPVEIMGADQDLQVARAHVIDAMGRGQHPPGGDHGSSAELPEPCTPASVSLVRLDECHLPGP